MGAQLEHDGHVAASVYTGGHVQMLEASSKIPEKPTEPLFSPIYLLNRLVLAQNVVTKVVDLCEISNFI